MERLFIKEVGMNKPIDNNSYLSKIPAVKYLENNKLIFDNNVTFIVGENGTGKSTLIEGIAIAMGFNPEGGTRNMSFSTAPSHSELYDHLLIAKKEHAKDGFFLRAESFYNVASNIDQLDAEPSFGPPIISNYGGVSLHKQSHGESFLALVENRFSSNGLYILDEPEAALSPTRLMRLLIAIHDLTKNGSQFIIATHSPILMSYPNACIYELSDNGINKVDYKETEHYRVTKDFIDKPDKMYHYLFDEE